jgi:hypothetical protein
MVKMAWFVQRDVSGEPECDIRGPPVLARLVKKPNKAPHRPRRAFAGRPAENCLPHGNGTLADRIGLSSLSFHLCSTSLEWPAKAVRAREALHLFSVDGMMRLRSTACGCPQDRPPRPQPPGRKNLAALLCSRPRNARRHGPGPVVYSSHLFVSRTSEIVLQTYYSRRTRGDRCQDANSENTRHESARATISAGGPPRSARPRPLRPSLIQKPGSCSL